MVGTNHGGDGDLTARLAVDLFPFGVLHEVETGRLEASPSGTPVVFRVVFLGSGYLETQIRQTLLAAGVMLRRTPTGVPHSKLGLGLGLGRESPKVELEGVFFDATAEEALSVILLVAQLGFSLFAQSLDGLSDVGGGHLALAHVDSLVFGVVSSGSEDWELASLRLS